MGLLDKVRDFFYDDEEDIEEVPKKKKKDIQKEHKEKIEIKNENWEEKHKKHEKQEISERELFKAERTFNFPIDVMDDDFSEVKEEVKAEKEVEVKPVRKETPNLESRNISIRNYTKYEKKEEEEPVKKFKPTPVISPIYGILDKNYKKEDLLIDSTIEESKTKKIDYEDVRKRAYPNAYKEEEEKDIFYNMEKEEPEEEVKIIYNDVNFEEEETKEDDKNKTIGEKIEEYEKSLEENNEYEEDDDNILSETKEQDLFNLIDNMYNSDEEEDEEEE